MLLLLLLVGFLGSDLKPLEEHEFRFSLRKSFSILGLRSIELNLFSCCVLILELRNVIMCCQKVSYVKRENEVGGELRSVKVE